MGGVHIDGGTENHEEFDSSWVGVHVPNCELFGGRSRYKESSLVARPVLRAEGVLEDSQPNSGYTGSAYPILSLVQGNYHPQQHQLPRAYPECQGRRQNVTVQT